MQDHDEIFDVTIFGKKTFSDLLKDIYSNSRQKERQITILIEELRPLVKTIGDATVIIPLIKEFVDVGVKNDELLVKMAAIIQRAIQAKNNRNSNINDFEITQEEMDALEREFSANKKAMAQTEAKISEALKAVDNIVNMFEESNRIKNQEMKLK